jgi:hypothetical protein
MTAPPRIQFAIDSWLTQVSIASRDTYRSPLCRFAEWCVSEHLDWSRVRETDVERFLSRIQRERDLAPSTVNVYRGALRSFYLYAQREKWVQEVPVPVRRPWGATTSSADGGANTTNPITGTVAEIGGQPSTEVSVPDRSHGSAEPPDDLVDEVLEVIGLAPNGRSDRIRQKTSNDGFVYVPVPTARVQEVYDLLASPERSPHRSILDHGDAEEFSTNWDDEMLARMYRESGAPLRAFLERLADSAGTFIGANELVRGLDLKNGVVALGGMLGALGNRCHSRYEREAPYLTEWRETESGWERTYCLDPEVASVVRRCREETD